MNEVTSDTIIKIYKLFNYSEMYISKFHVTLAGGFLRDTLGYYKKSQVNPKINDVDVYFTNSLKEPELKEVFIDAIKKIFDTEINILQENKGIFYKVTKLSIKNPFLKFDLIEDLRLTNVLDVINSFDFNINQIYYKDGLLKFSRQEIFNEITSKKLIYNEFSFPFNNPDRIDKRKKKFEALGYKLENENIFNEHLRMLLKIKGLN